MNRVYAFLSSHLLQTKIESNYISGVPRFTVLDLGPSYSKEISLKMRSALSSAGFLWRLKKQAIFSFDIHFSNMKKNTEIELSFIVKYLLDSGQITLNTDKKIIVCGEVTIHGRIKSFTLDKLSPRNDEIWIGNFKNSLYKENCINIECISMLRSLDVNKVISFEKEDRDFKLSFLDLVSLYGGHSILNLNKKVISLKDKGKEMFYFVQNMRNFLKLKEFIEINHIDSFNESKALISGDNRKLAVIQDYSLLDMRVKNLLQQENKKLLLFADTSLCPCGKAELTKYKKCGFSLQRCRSTLEKMSESGLSSFDLFLYRLNDYKLLDKKDCLKKWTNALEISSDRKHRDCQLNDLRSLKDQLDFTYSKIAYLPKSLGDRRLKSILLTARSIADLEGHKKIMKKDMELALEYGFYPLKELVSLF